MKFWSVHIFDYAYPDMVVVEAEPRQPRRLVGVGVGFERTRRITGYLVVWTGSTTPSGQRNGIG